MVTRPESRSTTMPSHLDQLQPLAEEHEAEQDRADRHDQRDQRGVGGAGLEPMMRK